MASPDGPDSHTWSTSPSPDWTTFLHIHTQCVGSRKTVLVCPSPTPRVYSNSYPPQWMMPSVMPSSHLILCCPFLLPPSIFPSIRVFSNESVFPIRWPKHCSFSFSINPSNEYSRLISFRINWLHLLAVQGTLKSSPTPQFKSINSSSFSFLYSPTLRSIYDDWKDHNFD